MSQTEERVVVLEFDNKSFEQNTQQSLKTLENLDNSLKNAGAVNGLEKIGTAAKKIDLSGLSNNVQNVSDRFSTMGIVGMTAIQNITNSIVDLGKKAVGQMISGGWTRAANIEKAKFQIEGLKGVWDETSKGYVEGMKTIKEAVNNAVDSTAYGLDEAAVIGSQLMASGITDANQLEEHLKSVSGLAAMTGGSYADIGRIYAQVAGQGRLMGNQLLQISQRGINVAATMKDYANANVEVRESLLQVAKASGKNTNAVNDMIDRVHSGAELTEADIRDLVSTGIVSFEFFSAAMGDAFAEHAKDANKTFDGALANMKAALNRIGAEFATPLRENLRDIFNAVTPVINNIKAAMMPLIQVIVAIGKRTTKIIVGILNVIAKITTPVDQVTAAVNKAAKPVEKVTKNVEKAGKAMKKVSGIMTITKKESKAAFDIWNKGTYGTGNARRKAIEKEGMSYKHVQGYVNALVKYNFNLNKVNKHIKVSGEGVSKTLKKSEKSTKGASKATKDLGKNTKMAAAELQKGIAATKEQNKETEKAEKKTSIIEGILSGVIFAIKSIINVGKAFINVFKIAGMVIKYVFDSFKKLWTYLTGGINIDGWFTKIFAWTNLLKEKSENAIKTVSNSLTKGKLGKALSEFSIKVFHVVASIRNWFKENKIFSRVFSSLGRIILNVAKAIGGFIKSIKDYFQNTKQGKKNAEVLKKIWEYFKLLASNAATKAVNNLEKISKVQIKLPDFGNIMGMFKGGGSGGLSSIFSNFKNGGVKGILGNLFGADEAYAATDKGPVEIVKKFAGNLSESGDLLTTASNTIGKAVNTASNSVGFIEKTGTKFTDAMTSFDWDRILKGGWEAAKIYALIRGTNAAFKLTKSISGVFGAISNAIAPYAGIMNAIKKNIGLYSKAKIFETFAIGIGILAASMYVISKIPGPQAAKAAGFMEAALISVIGTMIALSKTIGLVASAGLAKLGVSFFLISGSMFILAGAMKSFAAMDPTTIAKGMSVIAGLIAMFVFAGKVQGSVLKGGGSFAGMALAIDLLIPAIILLSKLKPETVVKGGIAIMLLMTELAVASRIAKRSVKNAASMVAMAIAVDLLVPAVVLMALIPFTKAIRGAIVIGAVLLAVAAAARAAGSAKLSSLISMTAAITILCGTIVILALLPMRKAIAAGAAITAVLVSLTVAIFMATKMKGAEEGILIIIGIVASIALLFGMLIDLPVDKILSIGASLAAVLTSISVSVGIIAAIGAGGPASLAAAATGIVALDLFIANLIAVLIALGGLSKIPGFNDLVRGGGQVFGLIGEAIGNFIGSIVSGFGKAVSSGLPEMGKNLSTFMKNLEPFLSSVKKLDPNIAKTIKNLASSVALLTGSSFLDSINVFGKKDKFKDFGEQLVEFVTQLEVFADEASNIDDDSLKAAKKVASLIRTLAQAADEIPNSGASIAKAFVGDNTLDKFGEYISAAASSIREASDEISGIKNWKALKTFGRIIKIMGQAAQEIPNTHAWFITSWFAGQNDLDTFAVYIKRASKSIKKAANAISEVSDDDLGKLKKIAPIIKTMARAAQEIPETHNWATVLFTGQNDLDTFAKYICEAAPNIAAAANALTYIYEGGVEKLEQIAPIIKALALASQEIPNFKWDENENKNRIKDFADYLCSAMPSVAEAANVMAEADAEGLTRVGTFINQLVKLSQAGAEFDPTAFNGIIQVLGGGEFMGFSYGLGPAVASFCKSIEGVSTDNLGPISKFIGELAVLAEKSKDFEPTAFNGIIQALGGGSISVLGASLNFGLGPAIANFCNSIAEAKTGKLDSVSTFINKMVDAASKTSGVSFVGLTDLSKTLPDIATNLKTFNDKLGKFKGKTAKSAAEVIIELSKVTETFQKFTTTGKRGSSTSGSFDAKGFEAFLDTFDKVAEKIKNFAKEMKGVKTGSLDDKAANIKNFLDSVTTAITNANKGMKGKGKTGIKKFLEGFNKIGNTDSLKRLPGRILNAIGLKAFETKGGEAGKSFVKGFSEAKGMKKAGSSFVTQFKTGIGSLYETGSYVGAGFVRGIKSQSGAAYRAGTYLFNQAKQAIEDSGEVESPSKVTMRIGAYVGEGFVIGLQKYNKEAYSEGEKLTNSAISGINDNLYSEFGDPVIKPVLDLSDVESGANSIGGMFGTTSINPQLVPQIQNRQNGASESEVFKNAVDKMSNTIVNSQKTNNSPTYNIGDVTLEVGDLKDVLTLDQFVAVIKKAKAFS